MNNFNAIAVYKGRLLVGAGSFPAGHASIYELADGKCWKLAAGFGVENSWGNVDGTQPLTYRSAREYVYRMIEFNHDLIIGFGASPGTAQVWRYTAKTE